MKLSSVLTVIVVIAPVAASEGLKLRSKIAQKPIQTDPATMPDLGNATKDSETKDPEDDDTWMSTAVVKKLWPEKSSFSLLAQYLFAGTWIFMISVLPFVVPILDGKPVTQTQKMVGAAMLGVLFGGLYLFTHIILFQSSHFDKVRSLTTVECIYFMSQVITTVGYGDITPAKPRGQVFVSLYVLGALFVIAMLVSQIIEHFTMILHQHREKLWGMSPRADGKYNKATVHDLLHPERPSLKSFLTSLISFIIIDILWVVFFTTFPGEDKTVFTAIYMSLITLTTVGFGAITPDTEAGMIFAAFFMIVGSASIVSVIGKFCEFVYKMIDFERFGPEVKREAVAHLKRIAKVDGKVTELEFLQFIVLRQDLMTEGEVEGICGVFEGLNPQKGEVSFSKVEKAIDIERSRSQYFDDGILASMTGSSIHSHSNHGEHAKLSPH